MSFDVPIKKTFGVRIFAGCQFRIIDDQSLHRCYRALIITFVCKDIYDLQIYFITVRVF